MPKGWEFFLAKSESMWLRELYVDLRPVKFTNGKDKAYALKDLTLSDCTFFPPQWKDKSETPLKLKIFVAGQTSEYAIDQFDLLTSLRHLE